MKIYLDDCREPPDGWILAKTADECIEYLKTGKVTALSLDHDLGEEPTNHVYTDIHGYIGDGLREGKTGYTVVEWMISNNVFPEHITVHSMNPVGRKKMTDSLYRYKPEYTVIEDQPDPLVKDEASALDKQHPAVFRVGHTVGNTLYCDDAFVGSCVNPDIAARLVRLANAALRSEAAPSVRELVKQAVAALRAAPGGFGSTSVKLDEGTWYELAPQNAPCSADAQSGGYASMSDHGSNFNPPRRESASQRTPDTGPEQSGSKADEHISSVSRGAGPDRQRDTGDGGERPALSADNACVACKSPL